VDIVLTGKSVHNHTGHSFRLHPEAVYAAVDDLELPSNEGVAKVSNCYLLILSDLRKQRFADVLYFTSSFNKNIQNFISD